MGTLLILAGLVGLIVGVVSLVRPIQRLRIATRKQAGLVTAASFVIVMIGGALSPADAGNQSAAPTSSFDTSASTSTEAPDTSSSGDQPATTTTTDAVTTTAFAATSTTDAPATELPTQGTGVEVVSVVDGDTVVVRFDDGAIDTVRLIGINTPERDECYAAEATVALGDLVLGRRVGLTVDATDRDIFDRLLRYIWVGDTHVNEQLVAGGYAIARRYPPDTAYADTFDTAQATARAGSVGMWAQDACGPATAAEVDITDLVWDPPGSDNDNLNGEVVTITNTGTAPVDLTGWVLKDESASHRYQFPAGFTLLGDEAATVHTGCGTDTDTDLYWCWTSSAIWNNDGDTAFLLDPNGNIAVSYSYHDAVTTTTQPVTSTTTGGGGDCDPSYPTVCIPRYPPDLNCGDISHRRFTVLAPDPHGFDGDNDGVGCESG
jgi:micrococcal nuclease